ncbi:MAG: hypothetical protein HUJ22_12605 [Gracilimonas sp.]|uniref:M56 family metallopeptidase n=1 Tax=Gracilimonas sp. TaxID=1974203 RepID=UPI001999D375|nr:M56 family metallopeptidase [Gracilimonas sp.]MBD3617401.1 hypothetical protein [Gracilimonas sp.]
MIIYLVKSTLLLGLLFGVYKLLLENEKMHRFNRFFLLFALIFGLTAPLISFEIQPEQSLAGVNMQQMERVVNAPAEAVSRSVEPLIAPKQTQEALPRAEITPVVPEEPGWQISTLDVLLGIYGSVTLFLLFRFVVGLIEIRNKVKAGSHQETGHATLVLLDEPITPQSFLGYIFLEKRRFESGEIEPEILDHEITHIRQLHSLDVLFIEFLKVIFWFNPLMYLFKHAIQLNHEFLADESVVSNGSSVSDYQKMLIRVCAGNKPMNTTSSISYSLTKKRFKMMKKELSIPKILGRKIVLIPVLSALLLTFCTSVSENGNERNRYDVELTKKVISDHRYATYVWFDEKGERYTGTQKTISKETGEIIKENIYENGLLIKLKYHSGEDSNISHSEYEYKDSTGIKLASRTYYKNGQIMMEGIYPVVSNDFIGTGRHWHPNGVLQFEMSYKNEFINYHGIMTTYDEEGNIIEQERYEDGELIEKIK